jgi:hypothetical protein
MYIKTACGSAFSLVKKGKVAGVKKNELESKIERHRI